MAFLAMVHSTPGGSVERESRSAVTIAVRPTRLVTGGVRVQVPAATTAGALQLRPVRRQGEHTVQAVLLGAQRRSGRVRERLDASVGNVARNVVCTPTVHSHSESAAAGVRGGDPLGAGHPRLAITGVVANLALTRRGSTGVAADGVTHKHSAGALCSPRATWVSTFTLQKRYMLRGSFSRNWYMQK